MQLTESGLVRKGEDDLPHAVFGDGVVAWRQIHAEIDLIAQKTILRIDNVDEKAYRRRSQYSGRAVKALPCALGIHMLPDS